MLEGTAAGRASVACGLKLWRGFLGLHEWEVAFLFLVAHEKEADDHGDPVHIVRDDRTVRGGVLPSENGVEDTPSTATI